MSNNALQIMKQKFVIHSIIIFIFPMIIAVTIAMWVYMSKFLEIEMNYYLENTYQFLIFPPLRDSIVRRISETVVLASA